MSILPIVTYNDPVLRQKAAALTENTPELQQLIDNMFETMYNGQGVGLAAPQIGESVRLFVIDADPFTQDEEGEENFGPMVFINPEFTPVGDFKTATDEGCLSIPGVRESVSRPETIQVKWLDRDFKPQEQTFSGWVSRVIQHEYDHIEGVLFIDYLGSFRRRLLRSRLTLVETGEVDAGYPIRPKTETAAKQA
ncbi:MAG: peptide deformylase [Candidatus Cyclonatronum sp.]|uniref:peptide deformylase n=1 Tax=Cyclonatronum sp. TaxID=3024185 RepID=UPI0025BE29AF|nr:peptide deformylase [Cyclonatronum sp.]MCC5933770.1 peptide deformylase [Balneolales bacterium]MCH8487600.1 peptide deformylase [Cyclonatronum sp.]